MREQVSGYPPAEAIMTGIESRVQRSDWTRIDAHLDAHGWAILGGILSPNECDSIAGLYDGDGRFRSHIAK